jgi:hypothetical protein
MQQKGQFPAPRWNYRAAKKRHFALTSFTSESSLIKRVDELGLVEDGTMIDPAVHDSISIYSAK